MNHKLLALACAALATLAIAGCKPQTPEEPAKLEASAAPATTAEAPTIATNGTAPALDQKGFAGTFASGNSTVTLAADGSFKLKDDQAAFEGSWTAEADGMQIRLDPNSKAESDRLYGVVGQDEIRPFDAAGQPIEGAAVLQRETPAN